MWEGVKNNRRIRTEAVDVFSHDSDYKTSPAVNGVAAILGLLRCGYTTPLATTSVFFIAHGVCILQRLSKQLGHVLKHYGMGPRVGGKYSEA